MILMSKHSSSIYFRCKTTVLAFTLSVTVMLLLTDLTNCTWRQKYWHWILPKNTWKTIANTHIDSAYEKYHWYLRQHSMDHSRNAYTVGLSLANVTKMSKYTVKFTNLISSASLFSGRTFVNLTVYLNWEMFYLKQAGRPNQRKLQNVKHCYKYVHRNHVNLNHTVY